MTDKEIIDQIVSMCESDAVSEKERWQFYSNSTKGDPAMRLQYSSTSHGVVLQSEKVLRFIAQCRRKQENG